MEHKATKRTSKLPVKMQKKPKISIIILNWNGKADSLECLNSIFEISYPNFNVILVDNGSTDGSQKEIKKRFPHIHLIENKENLGFTGGNNTGIKQALDSGAEFILLLNNDTVVEESLLNELLSPFYRDRDIGLTGPMVTYYNEPKRVWCAGCNYNPVIGKGRMYHAANKDVFITPRYVDWISFCVVLIKREVFERIGLLEDDYFSSYEDLDFCLKAAKAGFRCFFTPLTTVKHKIARDWKGLTNPLYIYYQTRNNLLCLKNNRRLIPYLISLVYFVGLSAPRRGLSFIRASEGYKIKYLLMGIYDFYLGNYGVGKLSFSIRECLRKADIIKIGINARYLQRKVTGIERYLLELIKNMTRLEPTKKFVLFFCGHEPVPDLQLPNNVDSYISKRNTRNRIWRIVWEQYLLAKELRQKNIQLFHGPSFVVPLAKPCKYILTVHDLSYYLYPESLTVATRLYFKFFLPHSLKKADKIIADSQSTKKDLIRLFKTPEDKINVIYLGIDKEIYALKNKSLLAQVRHKYNLPEKFILFIGMLSPRKNLPRMLNAFNILKKKGYPHKFVVVGAKGWLYESIFANVKKQNLQDEVIFTGYVPDAELPAFYKLADLFLFTTLYEGFGLPILEAMASGCPVVTSTTSSMPEVAGDAALLVDPKNVGEIAKAMENILTNKKLKQELIRAGSRQIKKFSWKKTAEETLYLYNHLLK